MKLKLEDSDIVFENLQWKEISIFLKYHMTQAEIQDSNFKEYLPRRKYSRRPPMFVRSGSMNNKKIRHQPWIVPRQGPDDARVRSMFCEAVGILIKKTMGMHDYLLDGNIYRQSRGGSIGLDLTGVVSDIYICVNGTRNSLI